MKNGKLKRIMAIAGIVALLSLYIVTFVAAIMAKPYAHGFFVASIFCSLAVPVLIYAFLLISKAFGKKDSNSVRLSQVGRIKKELKNMVDDQDTKEN